MIDNFTIFSKGGAVLWRRVLTEVGGAGGDPINSFITDVLLEERGAEKEYRHDSYTLKWSFENELDLVFVAVYLNLSNLLYIDELLGKVRKEFSKMFRDDIRLNPAPIECDFDKKYNDILTGFEEKAFSTKKRVPRQFSQTKKGGKGGKKKKKDKEKDKEEEEEVVAEVEEDPEAKAARLAAGRAAMLKNRRGGGRGRGRGRSSKPKKVVEEEEETLLPVKRVKQKTVWGDRKLTRDEVAGLDCSASKEQEQESGAALAEKYGFGAVPCDDDGYASESESSEEDDDEGGGSGGGGLFGLFKKISGNKTLARNDVAPVMQDFQEGLMGKNVAADIAEKLCESVIASLVGKKLASFTTIRATVLKTLNNTLERILTPKKEINVLQGIADANAKNRPYTIVFIGVNGVGKSTSLAKICAYFISKQLKVSIAACDTFRSGAIEQLKTHSRCLGVELHERGYSKDEASVAMDGIAAARRAGDNVLCIDTAGRMQDNENLMRGLAKLVAVNNPDLILFVGEALVGNDACDQLTKFNRALVDFSTERVPRTVDGIVLTKYDTIDDKVGAAISMTYSTGKPILFVGTGQNYKDLKKMNAKMLIKALLK